MEDLPALAALRAQWRGAEPDALFVGEFREWAQREPRRWWVAEENVLGGSLIGMVNLKTFDRMPSPGLAMSSWGYLANLYVDPVARGRGLGTALVAAVLAHARSRGLVRVVLSPSAASRPLYLRAGFRAAEELLVWSP